MFTSQQFSVALRRAVIIAVSVLTVCVAVALSATINGTSGPDLLEGTASGDVIRAGNGDDVVDGKAGADAINGENGNDRLSGGDGADILDGANGDDSLFGDAGDDIASGGNGTDVFEGGAGHDTFSGDAGNDRADGGPGFDVLYAALGVDQLSGGADNDVVSSLAKSGSHSLSGGAGHDVVSGTGNLSGGDGDDVLISAGGNGRLDGGAGNDICVRASANQVIGCETVYELGSSNAESTVSMINGPAEGATLATGSVTISFTTTGASRTWCVADTGAVVNCSSGSFALTGLSAGSHALAIIAAPGGPRPASVLVRHFTVAPAAPAALIASFASPLADTLTITGTHLEEVDALRLKTADGQTITYTLPDARVAFVSGAVQQFTVTDVNLGRETITSVEAVDGTSIVAAKAGSVGVASSITLGGAVSNAAASLTISGTHLTAVDSIVLVHDSGSLTIALSSPGVVVSDGQIAISGAALGGLHVTEINAVRLMDGYEVMASLAVDVVIASADSTPPAITFTGQAAYEATSSAGALPSFVVTAVDAVDGAVAVTCDRSSGSQFAMGSTNVTCQAHDASGNTASETFPVTVVDTSGPVITVPTSSVVDSTDPDGAVVSFATSAADVVDGSRDVICNPSSGSTFPVGSTTVVCESVDTRGNRSATTFVVVVRDVAAPVLTLTSDPAISITSELGGPAAFNVSAVDAVDGNVVAVCNPAEGATLSPGSHPVHCEAVDSAGNVGSVDFVLVVTFVDVVTQTEESIAQHLPQVFSESYAPEIPMGVEVGAPSADTIMMRAADADGEPLPLMLKGLFGFVDGSGVTRRIDTSLTQGPAGFVAASVPYDAVLPNAYRNGLSWGLEDGRGAVQLTARQARSDAPDGRLAHGDDHVLYAGVWNGVSVVANSLAKGVSEHVVIDSPAASKELSWAVSHPAGSVLEVVENRVMLTWADGTQQQVSDLPFGVDASGTAVPTWYTVEGSSAGDVLTLHWRDQQLVDFAGPADVASFPIDLDPAFELARLGAPVVSEKWNASTDDMGVSVDCKDYELDLQFIGRTFANDSERKFEGGPAGARSNCTLPGPTIGYDWYRLDGTFKWRINEHQLIQIRDTSGSSPIAVNDKDLASTAVDGAVPQVGETPFYWTENSRNETPPEGNVRVFLTSPSASIQGQGDNRQALLYNLNRWFIDEDGPEIESFSPEADAAAERDPLLSAGPVAINMHATAEGAPCVGGTLTVTNPNGDVTSFGFSGCDIARTITANTPGTYTLAVAVRDALGNVSDDERSFDIADPIASHDDGDSATGMVSVELEVADDLAPGAVQLWGITAGGVDFMIGDSRSGRGLFTLSWDSTRVQNGSVTLQLRQGSTVLDSARVDVVNTHPLQVALNAASTDVGGGFSVVARTGQVTGTFSDVSQHGFGGIDYGVERTYNSQDTSIGAFGLGWHASWDQHLVAGDDHSMTYVDHAGHEWTFARRVGGGYEAAPGQTGILALNPDALTLTTEAYVLTYADGHELRFDPSGVLVRETWPAGQSVHYSSWAPVAGEPGDRQKTISDDRDHQIAIVANSASGLVTSVTSSSGLVDDYVYDDTKLSKHIFGEDREIAYTYAGGVLASATAAKDPIANILYADTDPDDDEVLLRATKVTDAASAERSFDYSVPDEVTETFGTHTTVSTMDESGQLEQFQNANGDESTYEYNTLGQATSVTNENDETTETVYDARGHVESETDAEGNTTHFAGLDAFGNAAVVTDAEGQVTHRTFDSHGRKIAEAGPDLQIWTYEYEANSPLPTSTKDPLDHVVETEYDDTGQVAEEHDVASNGTVRLRERNSYDAAGAVLSHQLGSAEPTYYAYDGSGQQHATMDPTGVVTSVDFDELGRVRGNWAEHGSLDYTFDARGNRITETALNLDGVTVTTSTTETTFDQYGDAVAITDPLGHTTLMEYDKNGNEIRTEDPLHRVTLSEYDGAGNLIEQTLPGGVVTKTEYDRNANEVGVVSPDLTSTATSYTPRQNVDVERDERLSTTRHGYDSMGRETSVTNGENETERSYYDAAGRVYASEDALQHQTVSTLNARGEATKVVNPDLTYSTSEFDDAGRVTRRTNELGKPTVLTYDGNGRVLTELRPGGGLWRYTYSSTGRRLTEENPEHEVTTFEYDLQDQLSAKIEPDGATTRYEYDLAGNQTAVVDSTGQRTTYEYDAANQRVSTTDPKGVITAFTYTLRGQLATSTVGGVTTRYVYDSRDRVVSVTRGSSVTLFEYDAVGNEAKQTMPDGSTIVSTYDRANRKISEVHSVRGTSSWTYDAAGQVATETTPRGTTTYARNSMGRVMLVTFPDASTVAFTYDATGSLLSTTDRYGVSSQVLDDAGRVATYVTTRGLHGTNTYDSAGRLTQVSTEVIPGSATRVTRTYQYDTAGRLATFNTGHGTITYVYDDAGRLLTKTLPGLKLITYSYDEKGRTKSQQLTGQPLLEYEYDEQDRITRVDETIGGATAQIAERYAYSPEGRLVTWWHDHDRSRTSYGYTAGGNLETIDRFVDTPPTGTNTAAQDAALAVCFTTRSSCASNDYLTAMKLFAADVPVIPAASAMTAAQAQVARYMQTHPLRVRSYQHNSTGQLVGYAEPQAPFATTAFTYDASGNATNDGSNPVTYDYANRLTRYNVSGVSPTIQWTAAGKMYSTVSGFSGTPSQNYDYTPDDRMSFYETRSPSANQRNEIVWDPFGIAMSYNTFTSEAFFGYYNLHGDVLAINNGNGATINTYRYEPWGHITGTGFTAANSFPFLYNGRDGSIQNATSGGVWMGARTYLPDLGRFRQADPLPAQLGSSDTPYSYASNDPVNKIDPEGTVSKTVTATLTKKVPDGQGRRTLTAGTQFRIVYNLGKKSNPYLSMKTTVTTSIAPGVDLPLLPTTANVLTCLHASDDYTEKFQIGRCKFEERAKAGLGTYKAFFLNTNVATGEAYHRTHCGGKGSKNYPNATYFATWAVGFTAGTLADVRAESASAQFGRSASYACLNSKLK